MLYIIWSRCRTQQNLTLAHINIIWYCITSHIYKARIYSPLWNPPTKTSHISMGLRRCWLVWWEYFGWKLAAVVTFETVSDVGLLCNALNVMDADAPAPSMMVRSWPTMISTPFNMIQDEIDKTQFTSQRVNRTINSFIYGDNIIVTDAPAPGINQIINISVILDEMNKTQSSLQWVNRIILLTQSPNTTCSRHWALQNILTGYKKSTYMGAHGR